MTTPRPTAGILLDAYCWNADHPGNWDCAVCVANNISQFHLDLAHALLTCAPSIAWTMHQMFEALSAARRSEKEQMIDRVYQMMGERFLTLLENGLTFPHEQRKDIPNGKDDNRIL